MCIPSNLAMTGESDCCEGLWIDLRLSKNQLKAIEDGIPIERTVGTRGVGIAFPHRRSPDERISTFLANKRPYSQIFFLAFAQLHHQHI